jgi:hypothetical protein
VATRDFNVNSGEIPIAKILRQINIICPFLFFKKAVRGHAGNSANRSNGTGPNGSNGYSAEQKTACSIDAMINGSECEACQ